MNFISKIISISVISTGLTLLNTSLSLAINLGFFNNQSYSLSGLTTNLYNTLKSYNYTITEFDNLDALTWQNIANNNQAIVIPDLNNPLFDDLSSATRTVIRNYVNQGGGFLTVGEDSNAFDLMNGLFGWRIIDNFFGAPTFLNTANAVGTIFETGPSSLPITPLTTTMSIASLPTGSISFYDSSTNANPQRQDSSSVFVSPFGLGKVAYNGFDYNTNPSQAGGWPEATNLTVQFIVGKTIPATVPEPSLTMGLFLLLGMGLIKQIQG